MSDSEPPPTERTPSSVAPVDWDARYQDAASRPSEFLWASQPAKVLTDTVEPLPVGRALDIASGDGRNAIWLAQHGWDTTGIDSSSAAIALAERRARETGATVNWVYADATRWEPSESFDLISVTYLHLDDEAANIALLAHAATWLNPNGSLVVIGHDLENLTTGSPGPRNPRSLYTVELLARAAGSLDIVVLCQTTRDSAHDPETATGTEHTVAIDTFLHAVRG